MTLELSTRAWSQVSLQQISLQLLGLLYAVYYVLWPTTVDLWFIIFGFSSPHLYCVLILCQRSWRTLYRVTASPFGLYRAQDGENVPPSLLTRMYILASKQFYVATSLATVDFSLWPWGWQCANIFYLTCVLPFLSFPVEHDNEHCWQFRGR